MMQYLEGDELQEWLDLTSGIVEDYVASLDELGLNGTEALELARELCDKYNAIYPASLSKDAYFMWRD